MCDSGGTVNAAAVEGNGRNRSMVARKIWGRNDIANSEEYGRLLVNNPATRFSTALCIAFAISTTVYKRGALKYGRGYRVIYYELEKRNARRKWSKQNSIADEDNQIAAVSEYDGFMWKRIFNREEAQVFYLIKEILRESTFTGWHVHGQVCLGEIIKTDIGDAESFIADRAYRSISSKRVDMVVTDSYGTPAAIIEYNGGGHCGDDPERTRKRGRVKVIAAEKAGIKLVELLPEMDRRTKRQLLFNAFMEYEIKKSRRLFVSPEG
jgi:hypothetical protein